MPNTTNKDYTKYSQRQLFSLMHKKEQEIEKLKRDRAYLEKKMVKELEKRDQNFKDKIDALNELLQKISQAFDDKRDCCLGHEIPNIQTQQAMRDADNKETDLFVEDFSSYSNERKKALGVEAQS
ncbi:hypothetical protein E5E36_04325 [Helicobacter pylori]|uniref:hypothetical protein n=1 Tax=Helicobacter pylori TaxID=210 RepID=UPI00165CE476|nr:hypothetical protein [Helicobacter pylori]WRG64977.1 hypothetical protein E5E36_04325 [Helicobacter pylori]WRG66388.1 hypothetical protein E5E31_04335 [Helicobacter pylori]